MSKDDKWKTGQEGAERESSGNLNRIKFSAPPAGKVSTTILRLLEDDFEEAYVVFIDDPMGQRRRICISVEDWKGANQNHPLIKLYKDKGDDNLRASRKYYMNAVEGEIKRFQRKKEGKIVKDGDGNPIIVKKTILDPNVKLLEVGPKIFTQISSYRNDDEYPAIDEVIIKIERTGSGKNDTSYVVKAKGGDKDNPIPDYPVDMTEPINLVELTTPTTHAEVRKILGLAAEAGDEAEAEPEKESSKDQKEPSKDESVDDAEVEESAAASDDLDELEELEI